MVYGCDERSKHSCAKCNDIIYFAHRKKIKKGREKKQIKKTKPFDNKSNMWNEWPTNATNDF